jgi:hypothetical protein
MADDDDGLNPPTPCTPAGFLRRERWSRGLTVTGAGVGATFALIGPFLLPLAAMVATLALMSRKDFYIGISIAWLCIVVAGMLALLVL